MSASYVIVDKASGKAVREVFGLSNALRVDRAVYEIVPIMTWLHRVNAKIKREQGR